MNETADLQLTEFSHASLRLAIDSITGEWQSLSFRGDNLMTRGGRSAFSLTIDGRAVTDWRLVAVAKAKLPSGIEATLQFTSDSDAATGVRVWEIIDLHGGEGKIERWIHVLGGAPEGVTIDSATLIIEGLTAGDPDNATVYIPASGLAAAPLASTSPEPVVSRHEPQAEGAPVPADGVQIARTTPSLKVAVTPIADECEASQSVFGRDGRLVIEHEFQCAARLEAGDSVTVAEQRITIKS